MHFYHFYSFDVLIHVQERHSVLTSFRGFSSDYRFQIKDIIEKKNKTEQTNAVPFAIEFSSSNIAGQTL